MKSTIADSPDELRTVRTLLAELYDLRGAEALLYWDQATYLPAGGASARGRQMATLARIIHTKSTQPALGSALDALEQYADDLPDDHDDRALIRIARKDFARATRVPGDLMAEIAAHSAESYAVWTRARPANDFAAVQPYLEQTLALSRRYADCFAPFDHVADPLIDQSDPGMTVALVRPLFEELRQQLVPIVAAIGAQEQIDDRCLHQPFPVDQQWDFGVEIISRLGYDFQRGRQDKTHHPFMIKLAQGDARITTRVKENRLDEGLFSTIHECGHALYEMGIGPEWAGTPLDHGTSSGVHESQSRLWENMVGRSLPFWTYFYPQLQARFPQQLNDVDLTTFYRAVNKVARSLIRTDADEVTYNLHVIIRFGLELDLLDGTLAVADLPSAWHERYQENLGLHAPNDSDGVLQDVHWYGGLIGGAFQGYTLGNILAAQYFDAAVAAHPEIPALAVNGEFETLHRWLRDNIYRHGRKYSTTELTQRVTGQPLQLNSYLSYLQDKYGAIYGL